MTTKSTTKPKVTTDPKTPAAPTREEIRTAYQVHTLSQILYGHLATTQSWGAPMASSTNVPGGHGAYTAPHGMPLGWTGPFGW